MHRPDELDTRILREIGSPASPQWDIRLSYADIARKLGVDEETVRRRIKRATEKGSLPGWKLLVNPVLLGCEAAVARLGTEDRNRPSLARSRLLRVEGVVVVVEFQGTRCLVNFYYSSPDELERRVELMADLVGSSEPEIWRARTQPAEFKMRAVDWKMVRALQKDARRDLKEVAAEVGVSPRTVERRLDAMKAGHAVFLTLQPNFDMMAGVVGALLVRYSTADEKQAGDRWLLSEVDRVGYVNTMLEGRTVLTFIRENLAECETVLEKVQKRTETQRTSLETIRNVTVSTRWQEEQVGRLATALIRPRPS